MPEDKEYTGIPTDIFDEQPVVEEPSKFSMPHSNRRGAPVLKDWYRTALGERPSSWKYSPAIDALSLMEEEAKATKTLYPYPRWNTQATSGYPAAGGGGAGSVQNLDSYIDYAGIKFSMRANEELFGDWDYLDPPKDPVTGKLLGKMGQPLPERASGWHPNGEDPYYGTGWDVPWLRMQDRIDTARQAGLDAVAAIDAEKEQPGYVEPTGWEKFWRGRGGYGNIESKVMFAAGLGVVGMITDYTLQIGKVTEKWIGEERFYSQLLAAEGEPMLWQEGEAGESHGEIGGVRLVGKGVQQAFTNEHGYAPPSTVESRLKDHWLLDFIDSVNPYKYAGNSIIALAKIAKGDVKLSELKDYRQRASDLANMQYSVAYQDWDAIREFEERVAAGENVDMVALSLEQKWSEFAGRASINPINIAMPALRKIQSEKEIADIFNYVNSPMSEVDDVFRVYGKTVYAKTAQGVADVGIGATVEGQQVLQYAGTLRTGAQPALQGVGVEGAYVGAHVTSQTDAVLAAYTMGTERTLAGITTKATNFGPLYLTGTSKQFIAMTGAKQAAENLAQNLVNADDITDAYLNLAKLGSANKLEQKTAYLMLDNMLKAPELVHTEGAVELSIALRGQLLDADGSINPTKFLNKVEKYIQEGKDPTKAAISMAENYWKDTYPTVRQIMDAEEALKLDPDYVVPDKIQRFWDNGGKIKPFDRMVALTTAERGLTGIYGAAHRFQKLVSSTVLVGMNFGVLTRGFVTDTLTIGAVQKGGLLHTGLNSAELGIDWLGYEHPGYMQGFGAGDKEMAAIDAFAAVTSKGKYSEMGSFLGAVFNLSEPGTFSSKILETLTNPSGRGMVYVEQKSSQKIIGAAIDQASRDIIPRVVPDTSEIIASGTPKAVVDSLPQLLINKRGNVDEFEKTVLKKLSNGESIRTKDTMSWMSPEDKTNSQRLGLLPAVEEIAAKDISWSEAEGEINTLLRESRELMRGIDQQFPAPQVDPIDPTGDIGQIMGDAAIAVDETVGGEVVLPQDIYDTAINRIQANTNVTDAIGRGLEEIKSYINKAVRISGASQEVINHTLDEVLAPIYRKMRDPRYEFRKITGESRDAMPVARDFSKRLMKISDAELSELWGEIQASSLAVPGDTVPSSPQEARDKMWTFVFADYLDKFIQARRVAVAEFGVHVDILYDVLPPSPIRESLKGLAPYTAVQEHEWIARGLDNAVIYEDKLYPVGRLIQQHVAAGDLANANRAIYSYMNPHVGLYRHNNVAFDGEIINLVFGNTAELYSSVGEIEPEEVWDAMVMDRARNELPAIRDSFEDVIGDRPEIRVPEAVEVTNVLSRMEIRGGEIDLADEDALKEFALEFGDPVKYTEIIETAGSIEEQNLALAEYAKGLISELKDEVAQVSKLFPDMPEQITTIDEGPTGWEGGRSDITREDKNVLLSVEDLRQPDVDMVRTRENSIHDQEYIDGLKDSLAEGWDFEKESPLIIVEKDGSITLTEGTHRTMIASELGWDRIPANVRYMGNSQREHMLEYLPNLADEAVEVNLIDDVAQVGLEQAKGSELLQRAFPGGDLPIPDHHLYTDYGEPIKFVIKDSGFAEATNDSINVAENLIGKEVVLHEVGHFRYRLLLNETGELSADAWVKISKEELGADIAGSAAFGETPIEKFSKSYAKFYTEGTTGNARADDFLQKVESLGATQAPANFIDDIDPVIPPHDGSLAITEGRNLYEQRNILEATIRNIKSDLKKVWSETLPNMPKESLKAFKAYFKEWRKRMPYIKNAAHAFGQTQRDKILHAYAVRFGLDGALGMVRNFHFWPTRTMYQWAKRAPYYLDLLMAYQHYREAMEKEHASWPSWLRQSWSTNEIFGLESENPLYLSLQGVLDIFQNLGGDAFLDEDRRATWFSTVVDQISSKVPGSMGMIQQLLMAIGLKVRGEDEAAAKWAGRSIPVTQTIRGLTSIVGINEGRGIDLDPSIWAFSTNNTVDDFLEGRTLGPYDEKRVAVAMGHLLDKYPDMPEELVDQAKAHKGPLWDEAVAVVAQQGIFGNIISLFTGISARARSKDDLLVAQFWQEYIFLMVQYDNLDAVAWREQRAKLMDKYPFAELMLLARKGTEERNISYGYSVLSRIPPGETDDVAREAGFEYDILAYFYDNKGDISGLPQDDQNKLWTFFSEAGATIAIPDKATKGEWRHASAAYSEMQEEAKKLFGENILDKIDAGYNLKGESLNSKDDYYDYLEQFPEVQEAIRWQAEYILNHPTLEPYYASIDRLRSFWMGIMYQKLEDEFTADIWDIQTTFFIYQNSGQPEKASQWKKAHPELQEYWDRKNDFYIPQVTEHMAEYGEKLSPGRDIRLRGDFEPSTASTGAVDIARYINSPNLKTYTLDEWVAMLDEKTVEKALTAWEVPPDEFPEKTRIELTEIARQFNLTYEEFVISIGQADE